MKIFKLCTALLFSILLAQFSHAEVFISGASAEIVATKIIDATFRRDVKDISAPTMFECRVQLANAERDFIRDGWTVVSKTPCRAHWDAHFEVFEELPPSFWEGIALPFDFCASGICDALLHDKEGVIFGKDTPLVQDLAHKYKLEQYLNERQKLLKSLNDNYRIDEFSSQLFEFER